MGPTVEEICQDIVSGRKVIDDDIDSLICEFPALEGGNKGDHFDKANNTPTSFLGLTPRGANRFAERLGYEPWEWKEGDSFSPNWSRSQQFEIIREYMLDSRDYFKKHGLDISRLPRSIRRSLLDLRYNAGKSSILDRDGNPNRHNNALKVFLSKPESDRTRTDVWDIQKETLDIISDNGRFLRGLSKRRIKRYNEVALETGLPKIVRQDWANDNTSVLYFFNGPLPGTSQRTFRVGDYKTPDKYISYYEERDFQ